MTAIAPPPQRDVDDVPACFVCGCTDAVACPGGCWWAADDEEHGLDVCSRCVELRDDLIEAGRPVTLEQLAERTGEERDDAQGWLSALEDPPAERGQVPDWLEGLGS